MIPNYNGVLFVAEALKSVLEQDYQNKEIIVVDDGSSDGSIEVLRTYAGKIKLIETENLGAAAARNTGILAAEGVLIAFLDSDDVWVTNKLTLQRQMMVETGADLVYCHGQEFGNPDATRVKRHALYSGDCYPFFKKFPGKAIIEMGPSTALLNKELLSISGIFDTSFAGLAEDWDFFRRYCRNASVNFCDEVLVMRRNHSNNLSQRSLQDFYDGNKRAILKMFAEDFSIGFFERRLIWIKFHILSSKAFIKDRNPMHGIQSLARAFFPITL